MTVPNSVTETLKLGISACLLGNEVRYNGGHKQSNLCSKVLSEHFEFIPVCPEVAIGLGTPREPIRLIGDPAAPRAVGTVDPVYGRLGRDALLERQLHDVPRLPAARNVEESALGGHRYH